MRKKLSLFLLSVLTGMQMMPVKAEEYYREAEYIFYTEEITEYNEEARIGAEGIGEIEPGVYYSSVRSNYFYGIEVDGEDYWIYKYPYVEVKELRKMNHATVTTYMEKPLYSEPFDVEEFMSEEVLPEGEYRVTLKAFDWLYIEDQKYSGWIQTEEGQAVFQNTIGKYPDPLIEGVDYKTQIIPYSEIRRPGYPTIPQYITIHNTANTNEGSDAQRHADLQSDPNNMRQVSWHFTVDDHQVIQSLPLNEIGYHAGDGLSAGNADSIGIEICENSDGDFYQAVHNTEKLIAHLLKDLNLKIDAVKMHRDWMGKNCPRVLISDDYWHVFLANIEEEYKNLIGQNPDAPATDWFNLGNGNWAFYEADGTPANRWVADRNNDWFWVVDGMMQKYTWIAASEGRWYYVDGNGKMAANTTIVDEGIEYSFDANGVWMR